MNASKDWLKASWQADVVRWGVRGRNGSQQWAPVLGDVRGQGFFFGAEVVSDPESKTPDAATAEKIINGMSGKAINDTFHNSDATVSQVSGPCTAGFAELEVPNGAEFDYVMAMENLEPGQRIANYSVEY